MARTLKPGSTGSSSTGSNSELPSAIPINSSDNPLLSPSVAVASDPQMLPSYTLPQWLVPDRYKDKQSSQNTTQTRVFSVPLLQVPVQTRQAIRVHLMRTNPPQKAGMRDSERKLKELKQEEKQVSAVAKTAKDKLAQALLARSEKLKEIRKAHEVKVTKAMEELETTMREEWQKGNLKLKEKIKEECKLEYEKKFEDEMVHKRKREQEEDEKEQAEVDLAAKKEKEDREEDVTTTNNNSDGVKGENISYTSSNKVKALEKKQADLKDKMDKLSEKKSEMIWLLKEVIKQEALKKMKNKKLKKTAPAK